MKIKPKTACCASAKVAKPEDGTAELWEHVAWNIEQMAPTIARHVASNQIASFALTIESDIHAHSYPAGRVVQTVAYLTPDIAPPHSGAPESHPKETCRE